jgi:hypothetical protein
MPAGRVGSAVCRARLWTAPADRGCHRAERTGCRRRHRIAGGLAAGAEIFASAQLIDSNTTTLQVIDGLKALGASPSSEFVIPMEFTRLLGQVGEYLDHSLQNSTPVSATQRSVNGEVQAGLEPAARP